MPKDDVMAGVFTENPDETGWLLENGEVTPKYIGVIDGALRWTDDSLKALRLARREDGNALAEIVDDCWRIVEHKWCYPSGPSLPSEGTRATVEDLWAFAHEWYETAKAADPHHFAEHEDENSSHDGMPDIICEYTFEHFWLGTLVQAGLKTLRKRLAAPSDTGRDLPPDNERPCPACEQTIRWNGKRGWYHVEDSNCSGIRDIPWPATVVAPAQAQPDALTQIDIKNLRFYAEMAQHNDWGTDVIDPSVITQTLNEIAGRLELRASDPQKGQGREFELLLKLRAADAMAKVADDWVERGQIDSRSALADARLDYGKPFTYEFTKPLPAPPSVPAGTTDKENL